jgi:hypothetical protein
MTSCGVTTAPHFRWIYKQWTELIESDRRNRYFLDAFFSFR